jgi:Xaa-Pro aminopeptidase
MAKHLETLQALVVEHGLDAVVLRSKAMKSWAQVMTGTGCTLVVDAHGAAYLLVDGRYHAQAQETQRDLEVILLPSQDNASIYTGVAELARAKGWSQVGFEGAALSAFEYGTVTAAVPGAVLLGSEIAGMRAVKDAEELARLQHAVDLSEDAFNAVVSQLRRGMTDYEINALVAYECYKRGAERLSFDTIVGVGAYSAHPHCRPCGATLEDNSHVMIDFGMQLGGMQSDMTRVVFTGEPSSELVRMYTTVLEAQLAGIAAMRPGVMGEAVDAAARAVIDAAGYGETFNHGLGHGIGSDNETEGPLLRKGSTTILAPGMVASCEPGVYVAGVGGIRIEDAVLVTPEGGQPLNHVTKDLVVI